MANFSSLSDLKKLLPDDAVQDSPAQPPKTGYTGKAVTLRVQLDSKRRRGKTVTLVSGFESNPAELESLAQELRRSCGAGGGVLDNSIEIQGDHIDKVKKFLAQKGYKVK